MGGGADRRRQPRAAPGSAHPLLRVCSALHSQRPANTQAVVPWCLWRVVSDGVQLHVHHPPAPLIPSFQLDQPVPAVAAEGGGEQRRWEVGGARGIVTKKGEGDWRTVGLRDATYTSAPGLMTGTPFTSTWPDASCVWPWMFATMSAPWRRGAGGGERPSLRERHGTHGRGALSAHPRVWCAGRQGGRILTRFLNTSATPLDPA